jgi:hypothetical protein
MPLRYQPYLVAEGIVGPEWGIIVGAEIDVAIDRWEAKGMQSLAGPPLYKSVYGEE